MKKGAIVFILFFGLIVILSSCHKNNLDQPGFPGLRCGIGNAEYVADTAFYLRNPRTTIYAQTGGQNRLIFYLHLDTTGSIPLDTVNNYAYYLDGVNTYTSTSGSVNITQYYNDSLRIMSGSFSFNGWVHNDHSKTVSITTGYFNNIPRH